jgi:hypothetical protein
MHQNIAHVHGRRNLMLTSTTLLNDAIKEVYCEPLLASNPFGKLKGAYLRLEAVLYPWYLRLFCKMTGQRQSRQTQYKDLYMHRTYYPQKCTTEIQELNFDGITVQSYLDFCLEEKELVVETFSHCVSNVQRHCGLTQICLLHALHQESRGKSLDVFLLLIRTPPVNGKPNCYQRIGLMEFANEVDKVRTWHEMVSGRIEPRREEFWLF